MEKVSIVVRKKGTLGEWREMTQWKVASVSDAERQIRARSDVLDAGLDFAIQVTTITPYSEKDIHQRLQR